MRGIPRAYDSEVSYYIKAHVSFIQPVAMLVAYFQENVSDFCRERMKTHLSQAFYRSIDTADEGSLDLSKTKIADNNLALVAQLYKRPRIISR